jgi:hypothetical protein
MPSDITHEIRARMQRAGGHPLAAEHIYLIVAISAGILAAAVWWNAPHNAINEAVFDALRIVIAIAGCGYIVRAAETRVRVMLTAQLADVERARRDGYAAGYVHGVARRAPEDTVQLRSVN